MKVFITQHALTAGIVEADAEISTTCETMIKIQDPKVFSGTWYCHGKGKNWHTDLESARKRASAMRDAKIKSLEKSLEKLMDLKF